MLLVPYGIWGECADKCLRKLYGVCTRLTTQIGLLLKLCQKYYEVPSSFGRCKSFLHGARDRVYRNLI